MGAEPGPDDGTRGLDELYRVSQVVLSVNRQMCVRDVLQVIVRSARSLAGARYAALGVPGPNGSFAEFIVDGICDREWRAIGPLPRQHGMLAVLLREAQPLRLADIRADPRFEGWPPAHPELSGFLGVPVKDGEKVLAIIFVANKALAARRSCPPSARTRTPRCTGSRRRRCTMRCGTRGPPGSASRCPVLPGGSSWR